MKQAAIPFKQMIFVCTHAREGEEACNNPERGKNCGMELLEKLREEVKQRGLKTKIRVAKSGCMDVCAAGPNVMIFDENGKAEWLSLVNLEVLPKIVEKLTS